jgi:hypothetical protein
MILVDENGAIETYQNLDSVKALNKKYVQDQLQKMKSENEPIEVSYKGKNKKFIYYRNSDLLNKLTYYPIALVLILLLFFSLKRSVRNAFNFYSCLLDANLRFWDKLCN